MKKSKFSGLRSSLLYYNISLTGNQSEHALQAVQNGCLIQLRIPEKWSKSVELLYTNFIRKDDKRTVIGVHSFGKTSNCCYRVSQNIANK